jgi:hypothetical protein
MSTPVGRASINESAQCIRFEKRGIDFTEGKEVLIMCIDVLR